MNDALAKACKQCDELQEENRRLEDYLSLVVSVGPGATSSQGTSLAPENVAEHRELLRTHEALRLAHTKLQQRHDATDAAHRALADRHAQLENEHRQLTEVAHGLAEMAEHASAHHSG